MRTIFLIFLSFIFLTSAFGQTSTGTNENNVIQGDRLKGYLDSLKSQILADTVKFRMNDIIFTSIGRENTKPYSKLFIINGRYLYKLDIITGPEVVEFVNEILNEKKIKELSFIDSSIASPHLGRNTWQGIFVISMLNKAKFNPKVARLVLNKNKTGDNFSKRSEGEILIHD